MSEATLRPGREADLPALQQLTRAAAAAADVSDGARTAWLRTALLRSDDLTAVHLTVAVRRRRIIAYSALRPLPGRWRLEQLVVHPDHQRQGIGTRLLEVALTSARQARSGLIAQPDPGSVDFFLRRGGRRAGVMAIRTGAQDVVSLSLIELE